jgi:hypothetical protein
MADRNQSNPGFGEQHDWQRDRDESRHAREGERGRDQSSWQSAQPSQSSYGAQGGGWYDTSDTWGSQQRQQGSEHGFQGGGQSGSYSGGGSSGSQHGFGSQGYGSSGGSYESGRN